MRGNRASTAALLVTAIVAVAALALALLRPTLAEDTGGTVERERSGQAEIAELRQLVERMRRDRAAHGTAPRESSAAGGAESVPSDDDPTAGNAESATDLRPTDPEDRIALEEQRADARVTFLDEAFRAEPVDVRWAAQAEQWIRDVSEAAELAQSRVDGLECRGTLCRVDVTHESEDAQERFAGPFLSRLSSLPRGMVRRYPARDGSGYTSVVFLAREGHRFPAQPPTGEP